MVGRHHRIWIRRVPHQSSTVEPFPKRDEKAYQKHVVIGVHGQGWAYLMDQASSPAIALRGGVATGLSMLVN